MGLFGTAYERGKKGLVLKSSTTKISKIFQPYNDETLHSYTLPKTDPKIIYCLSFIVFSIHSIWPTLYPKFGAFEIHINEWTCGLHRMSAQDIVRKFVGIPNCLTSISYKNCFQQYAGVPLTELINKNALWLAINLSLVCLNFFDCSCSESACFSF